MTVQEDKDAQRVQQRSAVDKVPDTRSSALQPAVWKSGQWIRPGLPTFGWSCIEVEAPTNTQFVCIACNQAQDGPSHLMQHRSYDGMVRVDPACSARMQRTAAAAHASLAALDIDRAAKRQRWLGRAWKRTADGQSILSAEGFYTSVSFTGRSWSFPVRPIKAGHREWKDSGFLSANEAKLAAFDAITKHLKKQARAPKAAIPNSDGS